MTFGPINEGEDDPCSASSPGEQALIREVLARMVDKWGLWVLTELSDDGPLRFSRLLERIGRISQKSLTATLRQLERDGERLLLALRGVRFHGQLVH